MLRPFMFRDGSGTLPTAEQLTEALQSINGDLTVTVSDRYGDDTKAAANQETPFKTIQGALDYLIGKGSENATGLGKRRYVLVEQGNYRENLVVNPLTHGHITCINTAWLYRDQFGQLAIEDSTAWAQVVADVGDALTITPLSTIPDVEWTLADTGATYTGDPLIEAGLPDTNSLGTIGFVGFRFNSGVGRGVTVVSGAEGSADPLSLPRVYFSGCEFAGSEEVVAAFKNCIPRLNNCSLNSGKTLVMDNVYSPHIVSTGANYSWLQTGLAKAGTLYYNLGVQNSANEGSPLVNQPGITSFKGADFAKIVTNTGPGYEVFEDSFPNTIEVVTDKLYLNGTDSLGSRASKPIKLVMAREGLVMRDQSKLVASELVVDVSGGIQKTSSGSLSVRRGSVRGDVVLSNGVCVLEDVSIVGNVDGTGGNVTLINCRVDGNITSCNVQNTTFSGILTT